MCLGASSLFSDWGGVVGCEAVNFRVHFGLTDISVLMVLLMAALVERRVMCFSSVIIIWIFSSFHNIQWWEILRSESMNLCVHSTLSNIFLMLLVMLLIFVMMSTLVMMLVLVLGKSVSSIR